MSPPLPFWGTPAPDDAPLEDIRGWYVAERGARSGRADVAERTWRDLDGDALFRGIDHTLTPLGRQRLYAALREPESATQREQLEALATVCEQSPALREALRVALSGLHGSGGYRLWQLLREPRLVAGWVRVAPAVTLLLLVLVVLSPWVPRLLVVIIPLAFVGVGVRLFGLSHIGAYLGPMRVLAPALRTAGRLAREIEGSALPTDMRAALVTALRPPGVALSGVARWARLVSPAWIASNEVLASLFEYINLLLLLDVNALCFVGNALARHRVSLDGLMRTVGVVDAGVALASLRASRRCCRAIFTARGTPLELRAASHPLLPDGVSNDITLRAGQGLLLTGANMSGKSTLLRAVGCNVLLARALGVCTAAEAHLPVTTVWTCIGHQDELARGASYFYAEAEAVAELIEAAATTDALFLFDELFRGTNAAERLAAGEMVLRKIITGGTGGAPPYVAAATHDLQLIDLLADCVRPAHLTVTVQGATLHFTYALTDGPATSRTALALLGQLGIPPDWLAAAAARASALEG